MAVLLRFRSTTLTTLVTSGKLSANRLKSDDPLQESPLSYKMDYDDSTGEDCPKCQHSMVWLREYLSIEVNEGYTADDDDDSFRPSFRLAFNPIRLLIRGIAHGVNLLFRNVIRPAASKRAGDKQRAELQQTLRIFPNSLICSHCKYVKRDK